MPCTFSTTSCISWLISRYGDQPPLSFVFVYALGVFVVSYGLAFCSYHALEKRFLRLKRHFELPRWRQAVQV
jgi:peptidoglycan/LPS O-acetylase OafA/YrhL